MHAGFKLAVEHSHMRHDSAVGIKIGVEDQRLWRLGIRAFRVRDTFDNRFEHILCPDPFLGAGKDNLFGWDCEDVLKLPFNVWDVRMADRFY